MQRMMGDWKGLQKIAMETSRRRSVERLVGGEADTLTMERQAGLGQGAQWSMWRSGDRHVAERVVGVVAPALRPTSSPSPRHRPQRRNSAIADATLAR